ncbi:MAG: hypothetical protein ACJ8G1_12830 [Vitreoscilla sp.]
MNELAQKFLAAYAAGTEPEGGWTYAKALQQAKLDFTPDSLKRLDALLLQIRERAKPTRADLDTVPGRNFESLVVFYVIEFARRMSHAMLVWHDQASARVVLPTGTPLDDTPATRLVVDAPAQGALFKPLAWLEGQLLPGGTDLRAGDFIASVVAQLERDGPARWWTAMCNVGRLGSWHMMLAADGRGMWPTLVTAASPTTLQEMERGDLRRAVQYGDHLLSNNPNDLPWQVFSYPGFAERKGQRVDALIVLAATYGDMPMRMRVAFPFRPASDGARLVIWQPMLVDGNLTVETSAKLGAAMERGIRSVKWSFDTTWDALYQA